MALGANLPLASIQELATTLQTDAGALRDQLGALLQRAQRDPNFTGTAADRYDGYIHQWNAGQQQMLQALESAAALLHQFHDRLDELQVSVGDGFNV